MQHELTPEGTVIARAAKWLVRGYKLCLMHYIRQGLIPSDLRFITVATQKEAPQTLCALKQAKAKGILPIAEEHSESSIYGRDGNIVFRAFHDCGHLLYEMKTTAKDEVVLAHLQWIDLAPFIPATEREVCRQVYMADTVEQTLWCAQHGTFPVDQYHFVKAQVFGWQYFEIAGTDVGHAFPPLNWNRGEDHPFLTTRDEKHLITLCRAVAVGAKVWTSKRA